MARTARASVGGICYHVLNRGNARAEVFHKPEDYAPFLDLVAEAGERLPMRLLAWCLLPNHFHLVLWPHGDGDLSRWMQWLMTSHVRRYHRHYHSSGHVWQGRFKAFPIKEDQHSGTVLRYVERNALRANLVRRAEDWGGLWLRRSRTGNVRPCCIPARFPAAKTGSIGSTNLKAKRSWQPCGNLSNAAHLTETSPGSTPRPSD